MWHRFQVQVQLEPDFGWIDVKTPTPGVEIKVDGVVIGKTPIVGHKLNRGPHQILVDDGCHYRVGERIQVQRGVTRRLTLNAQPRPAGIHVSARDPQGNDVPGDVIVDGVKAGSTFATQTVALCSRELVVGSRNGGQWRLDLRGPKLAEKATAKITALIDASRTIGESDSIRLPPGVPAGPRKGDSGSWTAEDSGRLAFVTFKSDPTGAAVLVDGQALCRSTPCRKALVPGRHTIRMSLENYLTRTKNLKLSTKESVVWSLKPNFGEVVVQTQPTGLAITIDGTPVGLRPYQGMLNVGPHQIQVDDPCYQPKGERIVLGRGEEQTVKLSPTTRKAGIKVIPSVDGQDVSATVYVDEKRLERKAPNIFTVPVCSKRIRVSNPKHGEWGSDLHLKEKTVEELKAPLDRILTAEPSAPSSTRDQEHKMVKEVWVGLGVNWCFGGGSFDGLLCWEEGARSLDVGRTLWGAWGLRVWPYLGIYLDLFVGVIDGTKDRQETIGFVSFMPTVRILVPAGRGPFEWSLGLGAGPSIYSVVDSSDRLIFRRRNILDAKFDIALMWLASDQFSLGINLGWQFQVDGTGTFCFGDTDTHNCTDAPNSMVLHDFLHLGVVLRRAY